MYIALVALDKLEELRMPPENVDQSETLVSGQNKGTSKDLVIYRRNVVHADTICVGQCHQGRVNVLCELPIGRGLAATGTGVGVAGDGGSGSQEVAAPM